MPFQMDAGIAAAFTPAAGTKSQTPLALPPRGDAIALRPPQHEDAARRRSGGRLAKRAHR